MSQVRSRPRRIWGSDFLFLSVFLFLAPLLTGTFAAFPKDDVSAGEAETVELERPVTVDLERPAGVEQQKSPAAHDSRHATGRRAPSPGVRPSSPGIRPSARSPASAASSTKSGFRKSSPSGKLFGSIHSPPSARQALGQLRKRLGDGDATIQVATLQQWLEEKLSEGRIPRDELMKAVIAITGEGLKFADKTVPSTKTDLLRRTANQLSIGPSELRRLAQEVKHDPSLLTHQVAPPAESPPRYPAYPKDTTTIETLQSRIPPPISQASTPASISLEHQETQEGTSGVTEQLKVYQPVETVDRIKVPESMETPKTRKRPSLELKIPVSQGSTSEAEGKTELELHPARESDWLLEIKELLKGPAPPTPSPQVEEAPSFSPETQSLLASIPPLPGKPIPESTEDLLEYSPYVGVAPRWVPSLDEDWMDQGSLSTVSTTVESLEGPLDDISRQVDAIIAELQLPSDSEVQFASEGTSAGPVSEAEPTVEGPRASSPESKGAPVDEEATGGIGGRETEPEEASLRDEEPPREGGSQQPRGFSGEAVRIPESQPDQSEPSSMQSGSPPSSKEEVSLELAPHVSRPLHATGSKRESPKAVDMAFSTDIRQDRPRLWERTKAVAKEHKTMLKVTGGVALGALAIAGLMLFNRRLRRRVPSSSPLISTVEPKKCQVLVDFEKGRKLEIMGRVARIEKVHVNNTKRTLTVEYLEKPALRCSRGRELLKWFKYYGTFGMSLVRRVETIPFPDSCMAGPYSRFQVAEGNGSVFRLLVDLELNPGPLAVPRELMEAGRLEELLGNYGNDPLWKLYGDCVMHITIDQPFRGSPIVVVESARARVGFQNPELKHLSSPLPRECDWRQPWELRIAYKSTNGGPVDLLLLMNAADPPLEETIVLEREEGDAALEDPDDVLQDIRTLFAE